MCNFNPNVTNYFAAISFKSDIPCDYSGLVDTVASDDELCFDASKMNSAVNVFSNSYISHIMNWVLL